MEGRSGDEGSAAEGPSGSAPARSRSAGRLAPILIAVVALATLVAVRLSADEPDRRPVDGDPTPSTTRDTAEVARDSTGERALEADASTLERSALGGIGFTDVTHHAGLAERHSDVPLIAERAMSSGAAVADFDDDGWPDLYLTRVGRPNSLYRNRGDGTFEDVTEAAGVGGPPPTGDPERPAGSGGAAFADVDADGCVDLYVGGAGAGEAILYRNDCAGRFTDETAARGASLPSTTAELGTQGHGVTFADYDRDGDLDLLTLHWDPAFLGGEASVSAYQADPDPDSTCEKAAAIRRFGGDRTPVAGPNRSRLFRNDGTGHFTDVTAEVGLRLDQIAAFTGEFVDMDGDGWQDLLIAGDFCTSALYRNVEGTKFVDVTEASGVGTAENAMGAVVRDVDGDGRPDWFVTSIALRTPSGECFTRASNSGCSGNRLYLNTGNMVLEDATDEWGLRDGAWGWGAAIEDFGNDGRLQFAQTNGYRQNGLAYELFESDRTRFWVPTGDGRRHEDGAEPAGITDRGIGHAMVPFDYDRDGDQDLLIAHHGDPPTLYRNDSPGDRRWLTVTLDDPTRPGNRQGIGARVAVTAGATTTGWISTGGSYESQKPASLHVGLGDDGRPVRVEVWWPGSVQPQVVDSVEPDQVLTVVRSPS